MTHNNQLVSGILSERKEPSTIVGSVEGYKVFDVDGKAEGHQFLIGQINVYEGELKLGYAGFHFYSNAIDCAEHYAIGPTPYRHPYRYAKVRTTPTSQVISDHSKCVTDRLEIIEEISHLDFFKMCTGKFIGYYLDNSKRADCDYVNGRKHGLYRHWSPKGQLLAKIDYVEGQISGQCIEWNQRGIKIYHCGFLNGKEHGLYRDWYPNGQSRLTCHFSAGTLNGDWEMYDPSGRLEEERYYTMGI